MFITGVTLLIMAVNHWAVYRTENELIMRMCPDREDVVSNLRAVLLNKVSNRAIRETRKYMIAAKLLFIIPQQDAEQVDTYINRIRFHLKEKCQPPPANLARKAQ